MQICQYQNSGKPCKNWVVEGAELCPFHQGVLKREETPETKEQAAFRSRFIHHESLCDQMSDDQLRDHISQLELLLEDVKLRQQVASHVRNKRIKALIGKGQLSDEQKEELAKLRDPRAKIAKPVEPKISKEEREIQKFMKLGFSREKAMKLLEV